MRRAGWVLAALLAGGPLAAQQTPVEAEGVHVVRRGDTLWDLAGHYLGDPFRWPEIARLNLHVIADPHLILPEWRLLIPGRGAYAVPAGGRLPDSPVGGREPSRTVFFEDQEERTGPRIRLQEEEAVPVVTPGEFYRAGLLVPEVDIDPVGHLVEVVGPSVVPVNTVQVGPYERVYMRVAQPGALDIGDRLHLLRPGRRVKPHGRIFESTALARVEALEAGTATLVVEELFDRAAVGDIAVPLSEFSVTPGVLPRETTGVQGRIVAFEDPNALQGPQGLAFVDLGEEAGVTIGDEFVVVLPSEQKRWGTRPEVELARLRVVRVAPQTATVRVVKLWHPALEPGLPVRLVGKMP